jgi:hypothetical protein
LPERIEREGFGSRKQPSEPDCPRLLRLGSERHSQHGSEADDERATVHPWWEATAQ